VDFAAGVVRLDTSKNDEGRVFPFDKLPELAALLTAQREHTKEIEAERRQPGDLTRCPWVFHRDGKPIEGYKRAWNTAVHRAARGGSREALAEITRPQLVGRIVHDFRRTAVRNLVRAGVPEGIAMSLTGHKTRSVFDRYDIKNEADLRAGVAKLDAYLSPKPQNAKGAPNAKRGKKGGRGGPLKAVSL
jgi:hypothetical protein